MYRSWKPFFVAPSHPTAYGYVKEHPILAAVNGCGYETFGNSKHFPIKLQLLLIRAETLDKPLTAKCFIPVVSRSVFIFPVIFLSICYFVSVCRALGQTHSLTSFGFSIGSCGLAMCVAVKRGLKVNQ